MCNLPASFNNNTASSVLGSTVRGIVRILSNPTAMISFLTSSNIVSTCLCVGVGLTSMPSTLRADNVSFNAST